MVEEHAFSCPYCGETVSVVIDLTAGGQHYVEDCEVCCRPVEIRYGAADGALTFFDAARGDD